MKLIIREYIASLKERKELDAMLPDLLSQMGLEVFSKPGIGGRQYGVDVAAYGSIDGKPKKVYLFSVKSGDLGRRDWDGDSLQDLRPSLNEILDVYIPTHLPVEYESKPIEICICFGGDLEETVRANISQYEKKNTTDIISLSEWGGERLSSLIEEHLLKEELLPDEFRSLLRKSLALLDQPDISYKNFSKLIKVITSKKIIKNSDAITILRQLHLCLWILFAWCRKANNIEAAYQSAEITLLNAWEINKPFLGKKNKSANAMHATLLHIQNVYLQINIEFMEKKIIPNANKLYALSNAVKSSCKVDINLKLFDILGRTAMCGIWILWQKQNLETDNDAITETFNKEILKYCDTIKNIILNNPMLYSPYKDNQAIDISIAIWFLTIAIGNDGFIEAWLSNLTKFCRFNFNMHSNYPCTLREYYKLIEHPVNNSDSYRKKVTEGSILYPILAAYAAIFGFDDIYNEVHNFQKESLTHCNFQLWYPDETTEDLFYTNNSIHGMTLSPLHVEKNKEKFLNQIFEECHATSHFNEMSAYKYKVWPLILLGCRHYRMPVPLHFLEGFKSK